METTVADSAPETTTTAAAHVWTYTDSTGETFKVEDDDDTDLTDGVPSPVKLMQASKDCEFLLQETVRWDKESTSKNSEEYRENARAYAMLGRDLVVERDC